MLSEVDALTTGSILFHSNKQFWIFPFLPLFALLLAGFKNIVGFMQLWNGVSRVIRRQVIDEFIEKN